MAIGLNLKTSRITVATKLALEWSPQQIAGWLRQAYPDDPTMRVSHETIYLSLFVQSRGVLKKALLAHLWQRRTYRRPKVRHSTPAGGAAREARQQNPHVRICGGPGSATTLVYPTAPREGRRCVQAHSRGGARKRASDLAHHLYQAGTAADVEKTVRYLEHAP